VDQVRCSVEPLRHRHGFRGRLDNESELAMERWIERLCIAVVIVVVGTFTIGVLLLGTGLGHRMLANDEPRPVVRPMPDLAWVLWSYSDGKWWRLGTYLTEHECRVYNPGNKEPVRLIPLAGGEWEGPLPAYGCVHNPPADKVAPPARGARTNLRSRPYRLHR
jgi:hypothetical protein